MSETSDAAKPQRPRSKELDLERKIFELHEGVYWRQKQLEEYETVIAEQLEMEKSTDEDSIRQTKMVALERSRNEQLVASRDEYRKLAERDATFDAEHRAAEAMYDAQQAMFEAGQMEFEAKQKIRNAARKESEAKMTVATMRLEHAEAIASQKDSHEQEMKAMEDKMKAEIEALRSQLRIMNKRQP